MHLPDYKGHSTVNLVSSLAKAVGKKTPYVPLKNFPKKVLKKKNLVFLVIDGMGYHFLKEKAKNSYFAKHVKGKMTSVFPSTTSAANTVFMTGVPAQQHGLTAWFMWVKEFGMVIIPLRFMSRVPGVPLSRFGINPKKLYTSGSWFNKANRSVSVVYEDVIIDTDFSRHVLGGAKRIGTKHKSVKHWFAGLKSAIRQNNKNKLVMGYWMEYDGMAHDFGAAHKKTMKHFNELDREFEKFVKSLKGTDTTIIVTADHGMIDTMGSQIDINKHPKFKDCLRIPLCGEPRVSFCYVKPARVKEFTSYVKKHFANKCTLYKSEVLLRKNWFGLGKPHGELHNRIGDYIMVMKKNYVLKDSLLNKPTRFNKGDHGGVSKQEMCVPLIIVET